MMCNPSQGVSTTNSALSLERMPAQQQQFLSIISDFAQKYETAPNNMAKDALRQQTALRQQRAQAICGILNDLTVTNWIGIVSTLPGTDQGRGVLAVSLNKRSTIGTWNKLKPRTALHNATIPLNPGQTVVFSGRFLRAKRSDCIAERSPTLREAMALSTKSAGDATKLSRSAPARTIPNPAGS